MSLFSFFYHFSCRAFGAPFYIGIIVPFLIMYTFNWVVFCLIMFSLVCKQCRKKFKESHSKDKNMSLKQQIFITITLSILFGLGWGIGLLATQAIHQPVIQNMFAALFIILTAFQGLFIFLMHCLRSKEAKKVWTVWLFKVTGKEVDLSFSTSSKSNYWQSKRSQVTRRQTNSSFISHQGTINKIRLGSFTEEWKYNTQSIDDKADASSTHNVAPVALQDDDLLHTDTTSNIAYELPIVDVLKAMSPVSNTSAGTDCAYNNPLQDTCSMTRRNEVVSMLVNEDDSVKDKNLPNPLLSSDSLGDINSIN